MIYTWELNKTLIFLFINQFILEVNQVTLNQFKTTKFYKTMKEFYMTKPYNKNNRYINEK